jgi:tRNA(Arg) A34 adenosine deaminase TadA
MTREEQYMMEAIALSKKSIDNNEGGPFGCVIVKNNLIVGHGNNKVILNNDPTAHAEVVAIRDACHRLGTFQLEDCEIYTSCEPCPMCLGAIYWARLKIIYYANTRHDAASIGFDDSLIYEEIEIGLDDRKIPSINLCRHNANEVFKIWSEQQNKIHY